MGTHKIDDSSEDQASALMAFGSHWIYTGEGGEEDGFQEDLDVGMAHRVHRVCLRSPFLDPAVFLIKFDDFFFSHAAMGKG